MKKILMLVLILTASLFAENLQAQSKTETTKQEKSKDKSKTPETTETDTTITTITTIKKEELRKFKKTEEEFRKLNNEKNQLKTKVDSLEKVLQKNHVELPWWKNNWLPLLIVFLLLIWYLIRWLRREKQESETKEKDESQKLSDLKKEINELKTVLQNENQKQTAALTGISAELLKQTELSKRFLNLEGKILVVSDLAENLKRELENLPEQQIPITDTEKQQLRERRTKLEKLNSELKKLDVCFTVNQNEWKRQRREKIENLLKATEKLLEEPSQNTLVRLLSYLKNPVENDFGVKELLEKTTDRNLRDTLIFLASYLDKEGISGDEIFNPLVREFGAEVILPDKNESLNPQTMEAVASRAVQGIERSCVVSVERRGFRVGNEVVQKARVVLGN